MLWVPPSLLSLLRSLFLSPLPPYLKGKFLTLDGAVTSLRPPFDRGVGSNESEAMGTGKKLRDCVNRRGLGLELDS